MASSHNDRLIGGGAQFPHQLRSQMVLVVVGTGPSMKQFSIHKNILCSKIPFFNALFNGQFSEAIQNTATLPEDDPTMFKIFKTWVYGGPIGFTFNDNITEYFDMVSVLIKLYAFGEKCISDELRDDTMDAIIELSRDYKCLPKPGDIVLAYELTYPNSRLRVFMFRAYTYLTMQTKNSEGTYSNKAMTAAFQNEELRTDFYSLTRGRGGMNAKNPATGSRCYYHQHDIEDACPYS